MKSYLRNFVLLALTLAFGCAHSPELPVAGSSVDNSRIGVCSWSWRRDMKGVADEMNSVGVKGVHLALGPFVAPDHRHGEAEGVEALAFVKAKVASGEWKVMSTMVGMVGEDYSTLDTIRRTGGIVPDANWKANQRIVTAGARLTQELGCKLMSTHAGFLDEANPQAYAKYISRVKWMRDECRKYGVTLILESGQETAEDLAAFLPKVSGVYVNFDPANMILYGKGRPLDALKVLYPYIRQVHVKDARYTKTAGTWGEETPWGDGEVMAEAFVAELEKLGYRGNYVIEREGGESRAADIGRAVRKLEGR